MKRWERIVDQLVTDAIGNGDVSHLPGAGAPLRLDDGSHTPDEWRMAFKIMNDHEVLPDWIACGKALEQQEEELRKQIADRARLYRDRLQLADTGREWAKGAKIDSTWEHDKEKMRQRIGRHNREVLLLNLKLPAGLPHRPILNPTTVIKQAIESISADADSDSPN